MGQKFSAKVLEAGPGTETFATGTPVTSIPVLLTAKGIEPMAVGSHAVNKSGDSALVLGCGMIGMAIIAALRNCGVEDIVAVDYSPARRGLATTLDAYRALDPAQGSPFDTVTPTVVFEAVGVPGIIDDVLRRAPAGSRLVVAGVCMEPDTVHPFYGIAKEISVQFVPACEPAEFAGRPRPALQDSGHPVDGHLLGNAPAPTS